MAPPPSFDLGHHSKGPAFVMGTEVSSEPAYVHVDWENKWPDTPINSKAFVAYGAPAPTKEEILSRAFAACGAPGLTRNAAFGSIGTRVPSSNKIMSKEAKAKKDFGAMRQAGLQLHAAIAPHGLPQGMGPPGRLSNEIGFGKSPTWQGNGANTNNGRAATRQARPSLDDIRLQPKGGKKDQRGKRHQFLPKRRTVVLIASHLNELQQEDPNKILIVRKINRLGFDSADLMRSYFQQFGPVDKVRLSSPHEKDCEASFNVRLRPSGIGFVLFQHAEDAARALALGETQVIADVDVIVRAFERRREENSNGDQQDVAEEEVEEEEDKWLLVDALQSPLEECSLEDAAGA